VCLPPMGRVKAAGASVGRTGGCQRTEPLSTYPPAHAVLG
jgi:hypothetical protein